MSKAEEPNNPTANTNLSRRKFLTNLGIIGGIVALGAITGIGGYSFLKNFQYSDSTTLPDENIEQLILDPATNLPVKTSDLKENATLNFIYPRTGNPTTDSDSFRQAILIHLPKGFTAPNLGFVDPISGDTFIALSRVCVHLWCLCSYNASQDLLVCPCHSSQFVPGNGPRTMILLD